MGEEIGWRGYALPRLLPRYSPLPASLILSAVWAVWHLPLFLMKGSAQAQIPFGWYLIYTTSLAILFTWLYIRTGGSLLIVTLSHAAIQPATVFIPILPSIAGDTLPFLIYVMVTPFVAF